MRPTPAVTRWPLAAALTLLAPFAALRAQNAAAIQPAASTASNPEPKMSGGKKVLSLGDYGRWSRVGSTSLSDDGVWMSYAYTPNEGDGTLYIRNLDNDKLYTIPVGSQPQFSDDSKWAAYYVSPPAAAGRGGRAGGAGGGRGATPPAATPPAVTPPQGGRAGAGGAAPTRRFELLNLATGEKTPMTNVQSFRFSSDSRWVLAKTNKAVADAKYSGTDLIIRELATGVTRNIGNVNLFELDDAAKLLAYTVDANERLGNGVYLMNLATNETRALNSMAADFDQMAWSDKGTNLLVLRGDKKATNKQKDNTLVVWTGVGTPAQTMTEMDPTRVSGFPAGMVLSEFTPPRFSRDAARIIFGIKDQEAEPVKSDEPQANVDIWHYKDAEPQSQQIVRVAQERRSTQPAELILASNKFVRLADSSMRAVTPTANAKWGIGRLDTPYRLEVSWGGTKSDFYRVNMETGERTLIDKAMTRTMGTSPDSRWFLYLKDKKTMAYNLETGAKVNLDLIAGRSFVDVGDDHPYEKPTYGTAGWSKDGKSVLLYDDFDIWQVPLEGGKAVNLTGGMGVKDQIRFRLVRFDRAGGGGGGGRGGAGGGGGGAEDEGVDLTKPLTVSAYGEWTKKSGYYTIEPGQSPKAMIWADKNISAASAAQNANRVMFTQQSFTESPDVWVTNKSFATPRKITDANPILSEYAWGSKVLIDYKIRTGEKLQGTLTLPANYEPGKKYPMLVYFYEKMSNTHHSFSMPAFDDRPQMSTYASDGYLVLQPDVTYEIGKPGTSAVDCVTSAVKKVIELGYADPKHIGLQGHSWSGYQSSYIVTQTNIFAAVVTGAPPTDLTSFYDQLYKQTGTVQQGIMEIGQVRMGENVTPWNSHELYESQSPVHNVQKIQTPFMILQGTADGAVDWVQGLEFFNAARRNGKQVIFLSYPDEPHHLGKKENQKDFQIRMKQYFDHYLKGAAMPNWMAEGLPQTRKGAAIR
ncbi:MAG: prolyl oligopeptidase family serine peptidase [Gemmatimonas sp.]